MKLRIPDWKSAWFDNQISDRFFQEVSKLEKGTVKSLDSSAQWMEQVMIEVGQLAQAMIRLESHDAPDPQIRQAFDKALRLSAISLHLMTTLDALARNEFTSGIPQGTRGPHSEEAPPHPHTGHSAPMSMAQPRSVAQTMVLTQPMSPSNGPGMTHGASANTPPGDTPFPPAWTGLHPPSGQGRPSPAAENPGASSSSGVPSGDESEDPFAFPDESQMDPDSQPTPLISSIVQVSGQSRQSPSRMRETIQSLSMQGLSRAEIEMLTGEPRHIIEAVIEHHRPKRDQV